MKTASEGGHCVGEDIEAAFFGACGGGLNMRGWVRWFFWPFLLYAALFKMLARRGELEITISAMAAFCAAIVCAWCMAVFIALPDRRESGAWSFRKWPAGLKRDFKIAALLLGVCAGLCMVGGLFV